MNFIKTLLSWLAKVFSAPKAVASAPASKPAVVVKPTVATKTVSTKTAYDYAKEEVGTTEWAKGDNPEVVEYYAESGNAGVKQDSVAWCAAFVGAMLKRSGLKGTGKLNARSYLEWGVAVDRKDAKPGDIVVFKRGNSTWQGHVAFFVKDNGMTITVLGGNQSDSVNMSRYGAANLLGIRRAK
jgi:uncharacterized protein (TIGR02594 family)